MEDKNFMIYACDQTYGGLHGMYDITFARCTQQEAEEIGCEQSQYVMESFGTLDEYDFQEAWRNGEISDNEYEDALDMAIADNICYTVVELRDDVDIDWLSQNADNDFEELCELYAKK